MKEKISVIVPVYNVKPYLRKCVESIRAQTHRDLEIMLINDGSTDGSGELCDLLAASDNRIVAIHKPNGGLSDARNAGLDKATGEFIAFVDSDDWIDHDMMEIMLRLMIEHRADLSVCRIRNVFLNRIEDGSTDRIAILNPEGAIRAMVDHQDGLILEHSATNKLYRKKLIGRHRFIKGIYLEDFHFTSKILYECTKCVYLDAAKYNYLRERPDSIMSDSLNIKLIFDTLFAYDELSNFLYAIEMDDSATTMNERYFRQLIGYYSDVKRSNLTNKEKVLAELSNQFHQHPRRKKRQGMSKKAKLDLFLFNFSPALSVFGRIVYKKGL